MIGFAQTADSKAFNEAVERPPVLASRMPVGSRDIVLSLRALECNPRILTLDLGGFWARRPAMQEDLSELSDNGVPVVKSSNQLTVSG